MLFDVTCLLQEETKVDVKKVCVYLADFAKECQALIDSLFDEIWEAAMGVSCQEKPEGL